MSSSEFHHYTRDEFLAEFYPDPADKAAIAAGMEQLRAEQRAFRLAEMRRRLGVTQAEVFEVFGQNMSRLRELVGNIIAGFPADREDDLCAHALDGIRLPIELP